MICSSTNLRSSKSYINGLAMHGVESAEELISDPSRIGFIQRALHSASLLIQTQFESKAFRQAFRYTMVRSLR